MMLQVGDTILMLPEAIGGGLFEGAGGHAALSGCFLIISASFSLANREGLNLPDAQLFTVCRGKPMSSKAWRVFLDMYIFMPGILTQLFSVVNIIFLTTFSDGAIFPTA